MLNRIQTLRTKLSGLSMLHCVFDTLASSQPVHYFEFPLNLTLPIAMWLACCSPLSCNLPQIESPEMPRCEKLPHHPEAVDWCCIVLLCVLCYVVVSLSNYCVTFASLIRLRHRVYSARGCSMGGPCRGVVGPSGRCWQEILHFHYAYDTASCIRTTLRGCVRVLVCMWVRLVCVYVNAGVIIIIIIVVVVALSRRTSMLG